MRSSWIALVFAVLVGCAPNRNNDNGDGGTDGGDPCSMEGAKRCAGSTYQTCTGGQWTTVSDCPIACSDGLGCVLCQPGQTYCQDGNVWMCDDTGNPGSQIQACTGVMTCQDGGCVDACADAAQSKSYIGCEYWAADLDNAIEVMCSPSMMGCVALFQFLGDCSIWGVPGLIPETLPACNKTQGGTLYTAGACDPPSNSCPSGYTCDTAAPMCVLDAQHGPFAVVVSNPQVKDAHIVVTGPGGQTINQTITAGQVAPILMQQSGVIPDQSIDGTVHAKRAYRVVSDLPIVAYQFNPLDNVDVFSNDASLLIPRTAFDVDYYGLSWPTLDRRLENPNKDPYHGYLTVVAWQDNTQIQVTPTAAIQASATQTSIAAGATVSFTLNAFDVLQLEASGSGDLSGTHIVSTNATTFGLFGGHEAAGFGEATSPNPAYPNGPCCADHLEEMVFPSSTWGKTFAIARSTQRTNEPDYIRVMAQKAGTVVTFDPAPAVTVAGNCAALGVGQFCDVKIQSDTAISGTEPILVGHYLESSIWVNNAQTASIGSGDPSMAIGVPTEQYRTDYTILIPMSYTQNFISISAAATGGVTVDNANVTLTPFPGASGYRVARVPVAAGQHTIHCADTCGVLVYGYSDAVSYMFAGGLDLKQIVIQ